MTTSTHERAQAHESLLPEAVAEIMRPVGEFIDLDQYAQDLAIEAATPDGRRVYLRDYALQDGFFAESGGSVKQTPLEGMPGYSNAFTKLDCLQDSGAYKQRGAQLAVTRALKKNPNITAFATGSAGNAALATAQAVANLNRAAAARGELLFDPQDPSRVIEGTLLKAHIFGKRTMSPKKRGDLEALEQWGVILHTEYDELDVAIADAEHMAKTDFGRLDPDKDTIESSTYFVAPFNQHAVMAGQATLFLETLADLVAQGVDVWAGKLRLMVPVGGRGLLAGTLAAVDWAKRRGLLAQDAEVYGVQLDGCDAGAREYYGEPPLTKETLNQKCDGTAVLHCGDKTRHIVEESSSMRGYIRLSEEELGRSLDYVRLNFPFQAEPAGALGPGAALAYARSTPDQSDRPEVVVSFLTGKNATREFNKHFLSTYMAPYVAAAAALSDTYLRRDLFGADEVYARPRQATAVAIGMAVASGYQFTS